MISTLDMKIIINEDLKLGIQVENISSKVTYFKAFFYSGTNSFTVQNHISILNKLMLENINEKFSETVDIPMIKYNKEYLHEGRVETFNGYIYIGVKAKENQGQ